MQDRYDELANIIDTLDILISETKDRNYTDQLREIKYQAEDELEEIEPKLREEQYRDEEFQKREFMEAVI